MLEISKKICLIGDFCVGKTSLIRRFVDNQFSDSYLTTVGVKVCQKKLEILYPPTNTLTLMNLLIWDIEGHTNFKAIIPNYLRGSTGAILVADLTRIHSIENIKNHIDLFLSLNPNAKIVIALNKADIVPSNHIEELLKSYQTSWQNSLIVNHYLTSAKTGKNVELLFHSLAENI